MDIDVVKLKNLIVSLCQIVLTRNDSLSKGEAKNYIDHLKDDELKILNETKLSSDQKLKSIVDTIIDTEIMTYIQSYQTSVDNQKPYTGSPFDFDSAGNFSKFITCFTDEFEEKYPDAKIPELISCIFLRIDHYSEQYRMFEQFYVIRSQETSRQILSKTKEEAKRAVKEGVNSAAEEAAEKAAEKAAEEAAVKAAEEATRLAQQSAIKASVEAEKAEETAKEAEMTRSRRKWQMYLKKFPKLV